MRYGCTTQCTLPIALARSQELFDFARVADLEPGETVTLYFTMPPSILASVHVSSASQAGRGSATGGRRAAVRPGRVTMSIGDIARGPGHFVTTDLTVTGTRACEVD